jgi:hypothetical protein
MGDGGVDAAITNYVARELTVELRSPPRAAPFEAAELSAIIRYHPSPAATTAARRAARRAAIAALSTSEESGDEAEAESESEDEESEAEESAAEAEAEAARHRGAPASSAPVSRGLEDDDSLRYQLDTQAVADDLGGVVASTLTPVLGESDGDAGGASPSDAGRRVREILRRLEYDLERMSQDAKRTWRVHVAEQMRRSGGSGANSMESELAEHMQKFFSASREHVTLAQKHVAAAATQQSATLQTQVTLCIEGLLAIATDHVKAAVAAQTDEARAVIEWQRRERQGQLQESRLASSVVMQEAMDVTRQQAADAQAALVDSHAAATSAAVAEAERRLNEERLKALALKDAALRDARGQIEELTGQHEEVTSQLSEMTERFLVMEQRVKQTESQLAAAAGANKRLEVRLANTKAELAGEQKKSAELEQALGREERKSQNLLVKLEKMSSECAIKIAASDAHASACQAELDHAHEELTATRENLAQSGARQVAAAAGAGGGPSSSSSASGAGADWSDGAFDVSAVLVSDAASARVPSQVTSREEARLMAAVDRAGKAGKVVHLLSTPKKDKDQNSPANLAKMMRKQSIRRLQRKAGDAAADDNNEEDAAGGGSLHGRGGGHGGHQSLSLRETLALTHELCEHTSRSLRIAAVDDDEYSSPRARRARLQWKEKTSLPPELVAAMTKADHHHGHASPPRTAADSAVADSSLPSSVLHDTYEYFLGTTGHARLALARMSSLHKALIKHRAKHPRLDLWCRFLGLTPAAERYPTVLFHAYLHALQYVRTLQRDNVKVEDDGTLWAPLRAVERSVERCFGCWLKAEQLEKLSKAGSSQHGAISISMQQKALPFDAFIAPMMGAALKAMVRAAQTLKVIFWGADIRVDGQLSLRECKEMITQVVAFMKDGGSFRETAPSHAVGGDGSAKELLSVYRRLGLDSDEHGSISEDAWLRTAFEVGLIPTHDSGGRPFLRVATACWTAPRGPLERLQALLRRLERKQSELLQFGVGGGGTDGATESSSDAVARLDAEIKDWSKRRDRVEAILGKKLPPHGGRESGISAVRAVRALVLRINETEGRVLSPEEMGIVQADDTQLDDTQQPGASPPATPSKDVEAEEDGGIAGAVTPVLPPLPDVEWGSEAARECFEELQLEKEHVLGQLTTLRIESEELVDNQVRFGEEKDKLKAEITSLKKMLMKYTLGDFEAELQEKDAEITELRAALEEAETKLEEMAAGAAAASKKRSPRERKKSLMRSVSKSSIMLRRGDQNLAEVAPPDSPGAEPAAGVSEAATAAESDDGRGQHAREALPSEREAELETELLVLRAQLAEITAAAVGQQGAAATAMMIPGLLLSPQQQQQPHQEHRSRSESPKPSKADDHDDGMGVSSLPPPHNAAEASVRQMVAMLKAVGQVTGLNDSVYRKRGFALASTAPAAASASPGAARTRNNNPGRASRPASAGAKSSTAPDFSLSNSLGNNNSSIVHASSSSSSAIGIRAGSSVRRRPASASAAQRRVSSTHAAADARAAIAKVLADPPTDIGRSSIAASLSVVGAGTVKARRGTVTGATSRPRRRPASASSAGRPRQMRSLSGVAIDNGGATSATTQQPQPQQRPSSARVVRPKASAELVWGGPIGEEGQ